MTERDITARDGRTVRIAEYGDPGGMPVLTHNGTPNSRLVFAPYAEQARRDGVRLISYDRPGYGGPTRHEGRTAGDCGAARGAGPSSWTRRTLAARMASLASTYA